MAHRNSQDRWRALRLSMQGRRHTHLVVALIGFLLSVTVPVAVLSASGHTADQQRATGIPDNLAGLGVTGALPADPPPTPTSAVPVSGAATPPELPAPPPAPSRIPDSSAAMPPELPAPQPPPAQESTAATPASAAPLPEQARTTDSAGAGQLGIAVGQHLPAGPLGIPGVMLGAYQRAAQALAASQPACHLSWSVLASIGRIESGHASNGRVDTTGNTLGPILGPRLDGSPGMAAIPDTDHGLLDGDTVWDRAVGPMQFIPSSWRRWGVGSPNNIYDSTLTAGRYLCSGGANLSDAAQLQAAIYRYNHSSAYVEIVLQWVTAYLEGVIPQPSAPGPVPPGTNGNGGRPIVVNSGPQAAAALTTLVPPTPHATTPPTTTSPPAAPTTHPATTPPRNATTAMTTGAPTAPTTPSIKPTSSTAPPPPPPADSRFRTPASSAPSSATACTPRAASTTVTCRVREPISVAHAPGSPRNSATG